VFVHPPPTILHADLDAFFASVEQRDEPSLRGRPVIVGGGVVMAASYEARAYGVRGAMGGREARRLCPHAAVVPPRMGAYSEASRAVFEVFRDISPVVEGLSIDEAFLDVRGMSRIAGSPREIASRLREEVRARTGLPITVGVARTKFLAKVASGLAKPDGLLLIPRRAELALLHLLPVERLWGVGPATGAKLHAHGIRTVADVARLEEPALVDIVGRATGRQLHALSHGRDPRRVTAGRRRRSMGAQRALGRRGPRTPAELDAVLIGLVERVLRRMRRARRVARTVVLRLRFDDFTRVSRAHTLAEASGETSVLLAGLRGLLAAALPEIERRGITLLGVALTNLEDVEAVQLALPLDLQATATPAARAAFLADFGPAAPGAAGSDSARDARGPAATSRAEPPGRRLDAAVDAVRDLYGSEAITRGVLIGRDMGHEMPTLPDREAS
jgi:DNA polymerase-4